MEPNKKKTMEEKMKPVYMRCASCSGPLTYEDKVCPHCGRKNVAAEQHIGEKESYTSDYNATVAHAESNTRLNRKLILASLVLAALVAALVALLITRANMADLVETAREEQTVQHVDTISPYLDAYLEAGDYNAFRVLLNRQDLYIPDGPYEQYRQMADLTFAYYMVWRELIALPLTKWTEDFPPEMDDRRLHYLAEGIHTFYEKRKKDYPETSRLSGDLTEAAADEMDEQLRLMMKTYFGMADEAYDAATEMEKDVLKKTLAEIWEKNGR